MSVLESVVAGLKALERQVARLEAVEAVPVWTDWTPVVTQGAATPTLTVTEAKYCLIGKVCQIHCQVTITGAGAGAAITVGGIPVAAQTAVAGQPVGTALVNDNSTNQDYWAVAYTASGSTLNFYDTHDRTALAFALAANDVIRFSATYRAA